MVLVESYVQSVEAAQSHRDGGFHRLVVHGGGTAGDYCTPNPTTVIHIMKAVPNVPLFIYLGKKCGPVYNIEQRQEILTEIELYKNCINRFYGSQNIQGFVFHASTDTNCIDSLTCSEIVQAAKPLSVTYAKTYNFEPNSLEEIISLGFKRIILDFSSNTLDLMMTSKVEDLNADIGNRAIIMPKLDEKSLPMIKLRMQNFQPEEFSFQTDLVEYNLSEALRSIKFTLPETKNPISSTARNSYNSISSHTPESRIFSEENTVRNANLNMPPNYGDSFRRPEARMFSESNSTIQNLNSNTPFNVATCIGAVMAGVALACEKTCLNDFDDHTEIADARGNSDPCPEIWKAILNGLVSTNREILKTFAPDAANICESLIKEVKRNQ